MVLDLAHKSALAHGRIGAQALADLETIHLGHLNVEQDQCQILFERDGQGVEAVGGAQRRRDLELQHLGETRARGRERPAQSDQRTRQPLQAGPRQPRDRGVELLRGAREGGQVRGAAADIKGA